MAMFKGFKPQGMQKIANKMNYQGSMENFDNYLEQNPEKKREMIVYEEAAKQMAKGGIVKLQAGGTPGSKVGSIGQQMVKRALNPALPTGGKTQAVGISQSAGQFVPQGTGQVGTQPSAQTTTAGVAQAQPIQAEEANIMQAEKSAEKVDSALNAVQAAQTDPNDPRAKVVAAEQTKSAVSDLDAAQGSAIKMDNPVQREIQQGELIDGVANAEKAAKFTEQIQAAEAQPSEKATVQGQLASLTANFDATNPPAWAAGALRGVQAAMAQRGLGASSMAGQAMIQAAIESALPIAQADAQVQASFEAQNLSNRQARAMLGAEQRAKFMGQEFDQAFQARVQNAGKISDVANMNFTAEQQIALENSRAANTVNLNNLSNAQAMVMAEASALANLDMANLNNRQQAAVQNAQNFLQMDMANLSNEQATTIFKAQQTVQSLFTDQAQENAARQFNATSQNQTDQFFANLKSQTSQFNASQANAQMQFNAGEVNAMAKFNKEIANQRDQFNANNQLAIAQSNAVWRREIATAETAAVNRANEINAAAVLDVSKTAYDNLWSYYSDTMEHAWKAADNQLDRMNNLAIAQLSAEATKAAAAAQASSAAGSALGGLLGTIGSAYIQFG